MLLRLDTEESCLNSDFVWVKKSRQVELVLLLSIAVVGDTIVFMMPAGKGSSWWPLKFEAYCTLEYTVLEEVIVEGSHLHSVAWLP